MSSIKNSFRGIIIIIIASIILLLWSESYWYTIKMFYKKYWMSINEWFNIFNHCYSLSFNFNWYSWLVDNNKYTKISKSNRNDDCYNYCELSNNHDQRKPINVYL
jgi:hypothetical protein